MDSLVSICIPIYNGELFLRECLDSALVQDYKQLEIIIVDDQSTDNSIAIVNEYIKKDKRIKLFINEINLGLVSNWNECINKSSGEWIKFLFQDDTLIPTCISRMMQYATNDVSIISCDRIFLFENGVDEKLQHLYENGINSPGKAFGYTIPTLINANRICKKILESRTGNFIGEPNVILFRKNLIDKIGYFDPLLFQICDLEYWLRISCNYGLFYIPEDLATFRVHVNSTSATNRKDNIDLLDTVLLMYKFIHSAYFKPVQQLLSYINMLKFKLLLRLRLYEVQLWIKRSENEQFIKKYQATIIQNKGFSRYTMNGLNGIVFHLLILLRRKIVKLLSPLIIEK